MIWNTKSLTEALGVQVQDHLSAASVKFNSLDIKQDDIFIALPGARDGHDFVVDALARGAKCAIVSQEVRNVDSDKLIYVHNTLDALNNLALYKKQHSKAIFIAVTGSSGKTSTKEVIKTMLMSYGKTYASTKNFNNYLGVSLTLASMPDDIEYAIIEIGMNSAGQIKTLTKMLAPDIAIITTISNSHREFFESDDAIVNAKCEIFEGINTNTGIAIINSDMSSYHKCLQHLNRIGIKNIMTFGSEVNTTVRFKSYTILKNLSVQLHFCIKEEEYQIVMSNIPIHLASNFSIGFSVIKALGLKMRDAVYAIKLYQPLMGRGKLVHITYNNNYLDIICDYYNSNPQSLEASLQYLQQFICKKKVAILGDMSELGHMKYHIHMSIVPQIIASGVYKILLVGDIMKNLQNSFPHHILVKHYQHVDEMIEENHLNFKDGEIILIKGSRNIKLDRLAQSLGVKNVL